MSGFNSSALQTAIYTVLTNDAVVTNILGSAIYDAIPTGALPALFAHLGEDVVLDRSDKTHFLRYHDVTITVVTSDPGFLSAKNAASAICNALASTPVVVDTANLIRLQFRTARALRDENGSARKILLNFRAAIDES